MELLESRISQDLANNGFAQVRSIVIEEGADGSGDNALFIWILVDDALSDEDLRWDKIKPMVDEARIKALNENPRLYPYVRVRRAKEWEELVSQ